VVESRAVQRLGVPFVTGGSLRSRAPSIASTGFDRLFAEEYARVAAIANRILGDPAAAEDVAQDVFLDLHRRFGDDPGASAPAWLHAAAVHTALNAIRGERRRSAREERSAITSPTACILAARSNAVRLAQPSAAARAAPIAWRASSRSPWGMVAITSPLAGLEASNVCPLRLGCQSPPRNICCTVPVAISVLARSAALTQLDN